MWPWWMEPPPASTSSTTSSSTVALQQAHANISWQALKQGRSFALRVAKVQLSCPCRSVMVTGHPQARAHPAMAGVPGALLGAGAATAEGRPMEGRHGRCLQLTGHQGDTFLAEALQAGASQVSYPPHRLHCCGYVPLHTASASMAYAPHRFVQLAIGQCSSWAWWCDTQNAGRH